MCPDLERKYCHNKENAELTNGSNEFIFNFLLRKFFWQIEISLLIDVE